MNRSAANSRQYLSNTKPKRKKQRGLASGVGVSTVVHINIGDYANVGSLQAISSSGYNNGAERQAAPKQEDQEEKIEQPSKRR